MDGKASVSRRVRGAREQVYALWTVADDLVRWIGPAQWTPFAQVDVRPGGAYRMGMIVPGMGEMAATGLYQAVEPGARLTFTWQWEGGEEPVTTVDASFRQDGDSTEIQLTHSGFVTQEQVDNHAQGWSDWLTRLEQLCENGAA